MSHRLPCLILGEILKTMKNYRIVFTALAIILSALLLTTCISPFEEEIAQIHQENSVIVGGADVPQVNLPPGKGAILLKFGDDSRVTIAPDVPYDDLNFTVAVSIEDKGIIFEKNVKMNKDEAETIPIILDEGDYKVVVFGYYKTSDKAAYAGEVETSVASGGTKGVPIKLKGIVDKGGQGTFYYKISFPLATPIDAAAMKIESVSHSGTPKTITLQTEDYSGYDIEPGLDSGYYRVTITYSGSSDFDTSIITWILHIYPAMPTHYDFNLPPLVRIGGLTVTFNANKGSFPGGGSTASVNNAVVASPIMTAPAIPTRYGHDFKGIWYKEAGQINVWDLETERVWENITLFAGWQEREKFTVEYHRNSFGITPPVDNNEYYIGDKITKPADPELSGHNFIGWYKADLTTMWNFGTDEVLTEDLDSGKIFHLYARFETDAYTITYRDVGDTTFSGTHGSGYPTTHTYGTATTLVSPTKTGYDFGGWFTASTGTGTALTSLTATGYTANITLYAKWTPSVYTITYKDVGDTAFTGTHGSGYPTTHTYGTATTLVSPTKTGYTFGGWFTNIGGTGTALTTLSATGYTANITLYAKWTIKTYTVIFHRNSPTGDNNDVTNMPNPVTVNHGGTITKPADPILAEHEFKGWLNDENGALWDFDDPVTSNLDLHAQWGTKEIVIDGDTKVEDDADYVVILGSWAWRQGFRLIAPQGIRSPVWSIVEYPAFGRQNMNDLFIQGADNGGILQDIYENLGLTTITIILEYVVVNPNPPPQDKDVTWTFTISFREESR
jgi:uncharacterized repeat protein (TIGR02543 family)